MWSFLDLSDRWEFENNPRNQRENNSTRFSLISQAFNPRKIVVDSLDYACKYTKRIQELLIILKQTCPCINDLGTKLMAVTPRTQSIAKKNKLEDYPRTVRPSLDNKKSVVNTKAILSVPNSKLNVNSDLKCATCNGCLFSDNHDSCVLELINSVNARVKSKSAKKPVVQIVLWYLDSGCSKHMTGDRSQLINFIQKFLGTVKFGNDHVVKIMGYGDYKIGNVTILKVYFVEGLGHNLFSVGQFCDSDLKLAFCQHTCFIRNLDGVDLLTEVGISHEISIARSPQQNGVVERCNRTLIEAARTMLIYAQALLFLCAEVKENSKKDKIESKPDKNRKLEPKTYKDALTQSCWIEEMQEELNEFEQLEDSGFELTGFSDADYAGCKDTFKSWSSKKQDCTALSTAEA
nr:integrase, catalytic region, zinc finger, CCHC-type, peptidase aspartic, catalytic [Tanacetum cinerariifolium]